MQQVQESRRSLSDWLRKPQQAHARWCRSHAAFSTAQCDHGEKAVVIYAVYPALYVITLQALGLRVPEALPMQSVTLRPHTVVNTLTCTRLMEFDTLRDAVGGGCHLPTASEATTVLHRAFEIGGSAEGSVRVAFTLSRACKSSVCHGLKHVLDKKRITRATH